MGDVLRGIPSSRLSKKASSESGGSKKRKEPRETSSEELVKGGLWLSSPKRKSSKEGDPEDAVETKEQEGDGMGEGVDSKSNSQTFPDP